MSFANQLQQSWVRKTYLSYLLWPLSLLYRFAFWLKKSFYQWGVFKSYKAPVAVIVVGNITVGGTGKTPLVIHLVEMLKSHGLRPGVISRGYASDHRLAAYPLIVDQNSAVAAVGDEPLLIVKRTGVPMVVGPNRKADIELLFASFEIDVIISDDGLQHFAMQRDVEICLLDRTIEKNNTFLLPAGPYRESISRIKSVNFVVNHVTGAGAASVGLGHKSEEISSHEMSLTPRSPLPLIAAASSANVRLDVDQPIHAVAGIGNPQRFFNTCESLGLQFEAHAFPDHHSFTAQDIDFSDTKMILMTEKDMMKCLSFANSRHWYLPVDAKMSTDFDQQVLKALAPASKV